MLLLAENDCKYTVIVSFQQLQSQVLHPGTNYSCTISRSPLLLLLPSYTQPRSCSRYLLVKIEAINFGENPANTSIPTANQDPESVKLLE